MKAPQPTKGQCISKWCDIGNHALCGRTSTCRCTCHDVPANIRGGPLRCWWQECERRAIGKDETGRYWYCGQHGGLAGDSNSPHPSSD